MDELNEYLECTCGRCDDGRCRCCDYEDEQLQVTTSYEEINSWSDWVSFAVCRNTNWPKEIVAVARISALLKPPILFVHSHSKYSLISQTHWVLSRINCYVMPLHYPSHIKRTIRVDLITACSEAHNLSNKQKAAAPMCDCFCYIPS